MNNENFDPESLANYLKNRIKQLEAQVDMQLLSLHKLQLENTKLKNCVEAMKHNQELSVKWANGEVEN